MACFSSPSWTRGDGLSGLVLSLRCLRGKVLKNMVSLFPTATDPSAVFSTTMADDYTPALPSVKILFCPLPRPSFLTNKF